MRVGQKYEHKHLAGVTCEVLDLTRRGAKVKQQDGKKCRVQFYDAVDFEQSARGLWKEVQEPEEKPQLTADEQMIYDAIMRAFPATSHDSAWNLVKMTFKLHLQ